MTHNKRLLLVIYIIFLTPLYSAFELAQTTDARAIAMANANTAVFLKGNTAMANPALLSYYTESYASVSMLPLWVGFVDSASLNSFTGSLAIPLKDNKGTVAAGFYGLFFNADAPLYNEIQANIAYGRFLTDGLGFGINLIGQYWSADDAQIQSPFSFNLSAGANYEISDRFSLGLVGANLLGMNIASQDGSEDAVAREIRLGTAYHSKSIRIGVDGLYKIDDAILSSRVGAQFLLANHFRTGLGLEIIDGGVKTSAGFGLSVFTFEMDYAITYPWNVLGHGGNHALTLGFAF